jgi:hypothetical protein
LSESATGGVGRFLELGSGYRFAGDVVYIYIRCRGLGRRGSWLLRGGGCMTGWERVRGGRNMALHFSARSGK